MGDKRDGHIREWAELVGDDVPESVLEEDDDRTVEWTRQPN